jgi:hypothetical protein
LPHSSFSQASAHELLVGCGWVRQRLANVKLSDSPRSYARPVDCREFTHREHGEIAVCRSPA